MEEINLIGVIPVTVAHAKGMDTATGSVQVKVRPFRGVERGPLTRVEPRIIVVRESFLLGSVVAPLGVQQRVALDWLPFALG